MWAGMAALPLEHQAAQSKHCKLTPFHPHHPLLHSIQTKDVGAGHAPELLSLLCSMPDLTWYQPRGPKELRLCSRSSSVPPGRKQAAMLRSAAAGSGKTHRLNVSTTASHGGWKVFVAVLSEMAADSVRARQPA